MTQPTRATSGGWTYAEYARLPDDGNRYEVLDGEVLVTPAPSPHHQKVILRLAIRLIEYVESGESGGRGPALPDGSVSASGDALLLRVPSVLVPEESNVLVNPAHLRAKDVRVVRHRPFRYDPRLIGRR